MKRILGMILVLCTLLTLVSIPAAAAGRAGYDPSDPSLMLGKRVCDFNYSYYKDSKNPEYQPYQKRYVGSPQCVGYAYARIEEKLNLVKVGFNSGAGAKDMINNAKDGTKVQCSTSNETWTIRVHKNDGGAYLAANSFAIYGGWGSAGALSNYGHVIYVEEVRTESDGVRWVYYTEGSASARKNDSDAKMKRLSVSDFTGGKASSGKYLGCIVYVPTNTCSHSYDSNGVCSKCHAYDASKDSGTVYTAFDMPRTYRTVDPSPFRVGPYQECTAPAGDTPAGREFQAVGKLTNSRGSLWYKASDGTYVYCDHVTFVHHSVYLSDLSLSNWSTTGIRMNSKVHKPKGTVSEAFGVQIMDISLIPKNSFWIGAQTFKAKDPNGSKTKNSTSFSMYVDLLGETDLRLRTGDKYMIRLFIEVNGKRYYSAHGEFIAGMPGSDDFPAGKGIVAPDEEPEPVTEPTPTPTPTPAPSDPVVTLKPTDDANYKAKEFVNETNACVVTKIVKKSGSSITRSGVELYSADGSLLKDYWHKVTNVAAKTTTFHSWYNFKDEVGYTLTPGTTYQYRFHVTVNGGDYYSEFYSFTTRSTAPKPANAWIRADRTEALAGEPLRFTFGADHAAHYNLLVDPVSGGRYTSVGADGTGEYSLVIYDPGRYTVTLHAFNDDGSDADSAPVTVEVFPAVDAPVVTADRDEVRPDELITFRYGVENAERYTMTLYFRDQVYPGKRDADLDGEMGLHFTQPGDYALAVTAYDHFGEAHEGTPAYFTVLDPEQKDFVVSYGANCSDWTGALPADQNVHYGDTSTLSDGAGLARPGWRLVGWTRTEGGTQAEFDPGERVTITLVRDIMLYAVWEASATPEVHFPRVRSYHSGTFVDVRASDWFDSGVGEAYALGLMQGIGDSRFDPNGQVTLAQAVTMAARVHSIYFTGSESFGSSSGPWYQVYVNYAIANGILPGDLYGADMNRPATRAEFARIFSAAMDDAGLYPVNRVAEGGIPDVRAGDACHDAVYRLYRAGILTGSDARGTFHPASSITRAEAAAIVSRMGDSSARRAVTPA